MPSIFDNLTPEQCGEQMAYNHIAFAKNLTMEYLLDLIDKTEKSFYPFKSNDAKKEFNAYRKVLLNKIKEINKRR